MNFPFPLFFLFVLLISTFAWPGFWKAVFEVPRAALITGVIRIGSIFAGVVCCALRLYVPHVVPSLPGTYEALAHVFVGLLIGVWICVRDRIVLSVLIAITLFEGVAFFLTK